ncbi:outer membrane scaffolding protein for murein synthesis (MipA/OmpV family) [Rhodoblastus acidophilus]|uniref:MipA/OmpV family protein n=1 Tax=Rhodoblastus acidophilus TaxID=1074 RepID=UPI0018B06131|nr:MipA/OmpV family protein [Rhodoblastus acidophilus]MCW2274608.1 outer membrane scaffolding protein for murein synthesis (MipA/OmpV family) [Rhodoblastus acidophilus]
MKFPLRTLLAALAVGTGAAQAADLSSVKAEPAPASDDWYVTVSGTVNAGPSYPGSKGYSIFGYPSIRLRRVGEREIFSAPDDGFNFAFYNDGLFRAGVVGRLVGDRSVSDNAALRGLAYVPYSFEIGGFAEVSPVSWGRLRAEVRQAVTGHSGLAATIGGDVWQSWNRFTLSVGPRAYFGNDQYAKTYFSVTPTQAAVNNFLGGNLTPYAAAGGLTGAGGTVALRYQIDDNWRATGYGNYQRLSNSVGASPIANSAGDGSRNQWAYGLELSYRFRTTSPIIPGLF